jgi:hypothetical protein
MWHSISTCHCTFFSQCPGRMLSNHSLGNELEAVPIPKISFFIQLLSCEQSSMNVPNNPQSWLERWGTQGSYLTWCIVLACAGQRVHFHIHCPVSSSKLAIE